MATLQYFCTKLEELFSDWQNDRNMIVFRETDKQKLLILREIFRDLFSHFGRRQMS